MKIRKGFVSNSSSTSFTITNKSDKDLYLVDFVKENPQLVKEYNEEYGWGEDRYTQEDLIKCAESRNEVFPSDSTRNYVYGDEDGDSIGSVFDYILRDGGTSENFEWSFNEFYR